MQVHFKTPIPVANFRDVSPLSPHYIEYPCIQLLQTIRYLLNEVERLRDLQNTKIEEENFSEAERLDEEIAKLKEEVGLCVILLPDAKCTIWFHGSIKCADEGFSEQ